MSKFHIEPLRLYWWVLLIIHLAGCSGGSATEQKQVIIPAELRSEGRVWIQQPTLAGPDERLLAGWFQKNPSVADNPAVKGQPVVYEAGSSRRFYWSAARANQVLWFFVEFNGSRFVTSSDGQGTPFSLQ